MSAYTYAAFFLVAVALGIAAVGFIDFLRRVDRAAEARRVEHDRDAWLAAVASDRSAPIHDRLAATWLAAELDDPHAVEAWLNGGAA